VLAVVTMPSAYPARNQPENLADLVAAAARRAASVTAAELAAVEPLQALDAGELASPSRREQLMHAAGRLFSEHGYEAVSMGDIGDAVGMTGPSIYYYFDSKAEILTSIFRRGLEWLAVDRSRSPRGRADEWAPLRIFLESYARLALSWWEIFRLFVHEQFALQHIDEGAVVRAYRDYVNGGVALLRERRPELSAGEARTLLACAMSIINDLAITRTSHDDAATATGLVAIATAVLDA